MTVWAAPMKEMPMSGQSGFNELPESNPKGQVKPCA
jgi:hypothetical protein